MAPSPPPSCVFQTSWSQHRNICACFLPRGSLDSWESKQAFVNHFLAWNIEGENPSGPDSYPGFTLCKLFTLWLHQLSSIPMLSFWLFVSVSFWALTDLDSAFPKLGTSGNEIVNLQHILHFVSKCQLSFSSLPSPVKLFWSELESSSVNRVL